MNGLQILTNASQTIRKLNPDLFSGRPAHLEPRALNVPAAAYETEKADPQDYRDYPVILTVIEYRHRLHDADGGCAKWLIDAVVTEGLLPDDSPEFVSEVKYRQKKIDRRQQEYTEILIGV